MMKKYLYVVKDEPRYIEEQSCYCYVVKAANEKEAIEIVKKRTDFSTIDWNVSLVDNNEVWE